MTLSCRQYGSVLPYSNDCIPARAIVGYPTVHLPRHTDIKIDELCAKAKAAKTEPEVRQVVGQLRSALSEHIGLARESLEAQVSALSTLEAKTKADLPKTRKARPRKRQEKNSGSGETLSDSGSSRSNAA
jgi:hypothetical protein